MGGPPAWRLSRRITNPQLKIRQMPKYFTDHKATYAEHNKEN